MKVGDGRRSGVGSPAGASLGGGRASTCRPAEEFQRLRSVTLLSPRRCVEAGIRGVV